MQSAVCFCEEKKIEFSRSGGFECSLKQASISPSFVNKVVAVGITINENRAHGFHGTDGRGL